MLLVLVSVTVLVLGSTGPFNSVRGKVSDAFAPVRRVGGSITSPFSDLFGSATRYQKVRKENTSLKQQLAAAQGQAAKAQDAIRERAELLALNRLENVDKLASVDARVVSQPLGNFDTTIELDVGTDRGVRAGMPVRTGAGLVGRVTYATAKQSRVLLIVDEHSKVGVRLSTSGEVGVANGTGSSSSMSVDYIDPETKVIEREILVTSGLQNSRFPAGIPVGMVSTHTVSAAALQQSLTMQPLADLEHLTFVQVVLWQQTEVFPPTPTVVLRPTTTVFGDAVPTTTVVP